MWTSFSLDLPHAVFFVYNSSQVTRSHCRNNDSNGGHEVATTEDDVTTGSFLVLSLHVVAQVGLAAAVQVIPAILHCSSAAFLAAS